MKDDLEKKKKVSKLKEIAKAVGAGGIKNSVSDDTKKKITSGLSNIGKKTVEANSKTIGQTAKQTWTTDKSGTTRKSNDGYIAPTSKGIKKNKEDEEKGIKLHYNDPVITRGTLKR